MVILNFEFHVDPPDPAVPGDGEEPSLETGSATEEGKVVGSS